MDQDETWQAGGLDRGHIVLDGDAAPPPQKESEPQFLAHICCGQMAGWINMPLGREVCLSPSNVLDGDPARLLRKRGTAAPALLTHVYCGHGRPSTAELLLNTVSCSNVM